jgi:L-methionine (R)-S-oxide reductase
MAYLLTMAETLNIPRGAGRAEIYRALLPQLQALLSGERDPVANAANFVAALREAFGFFWVGIYRVRGEELVLGPFQGPIACTRIARGKGVCGTSWQGERTVLVPDVEVFPGHIACNSEARSEIVVPIRDAAGKVIGVLDVDSAALDDFSKVDEEGLERLVALIRDL